MLSLHDGEAEIVRFSSVAIFSYFSFRFCSQVTLSCFQRFLYEIYTNFLSSSSRHRVKLAYSLWHNALYTFIYEMRSHLPYEYSVYSHTIQSHECGFMKLLQVHFHHLSSLQSDFLSKKKCFITSGNGEKERERAREWQWEKHTNGKMSDSRKFCLFNVVTHTCQKKHFFHYFMM